MANNTATNHWCGKKLSSKRTRKVKELLKYISLYNTKAKVTNHGHCD